MQYRLARVVNDFDDIWFDVQKFLGKLYCPIKKLLGDRRVKLDDVNFIKEYLAPSSLEKRSSKVYIKYIQGGP